MSGVSRAMPQALAGDGGSSVCTPTGSRKRLLTGELNKNNLRIPSNVTSNTLESISEPSSPGGPRKRRRYSQRQVDGNLPRPGSRESSSVSTPEPLTHDEHIEKHGPRASIFASDSSDIEEDDRQQFHASSVAVRETSNTEDVERGVPPIAELVRSWLTLRPAFAIREVMGRVRNMTSWFSVTHLDEEVEPADVDMESNISGIQQPVIARTEPQAEPLSTEHSHLGLQSDDSSECSTDEHSQNSPDLGPMIKTQQITPDSSWGSIQEHGTSYLLSEGKRREFEKTTTRAQSSIDDGGPGTSRSMKSAVNDFDDNLRGPSDSFIQKPRRFFQVGRVFKILCTEPEGNRPLSKNSITSPLADYGQGTRSKVRPFIVVRQKRKFCTCLPLYFCTGTRTGEREEVECSDYAFVNTSEGQVVPEIGHDMTRELFPVNVEDKNETMAPMTCIDFDFDQARTIEYTVGVANIGKIEDEDIPRLTQNFERSSTSEARYRGAEGGTSDQGEDEEVLEMDSSPSYSESLSTLNHTGARARSTSLDPGSPSTSEPAPITSEDEGTFNRHNVIVFPRGLQRKHERDRDPSSILLDTASHADLVASAYANKLDVPRYRLSKPEKVEGIGGQMVEISEYISVGLEWHRGKFRENHKFHILEGEHDFELLWSARTIKDKGIYRKPGQGRIFVITAKNKNKISQADKKRNQEFHDKTVRMAQENEADFASQEWEESAKYDYTDEITHDQQHNQEAPEKPSESKDGGKRRRHTNHRRDPKPT